jgi:hypothetical protein
MICGSPSHIYRDMLAWYKRSRNHMKIYWLLTVGVRRSAVAFRDDANAPEAASEDDTAPLLFSVSVDLPGNGNKNDH